MFKHFFIFIFITFLFGAAFAQPVKNSLVAYYPMDGCVASDSSGATNVSDGIIIGGVTCGCGIDGDALKFTGTGNQSVLFLGKVNDFFTRVDFTISFYIRPLSTIGVEEILSKRFECAPAPGFSIRYSSGLKQIIAEMSESATKSISLSAKLEDGKCWQHVVLTRQNLTTKLYINGVLKAQETINTSRLNMSNNGILSVSEGPCIANSSAKRYNGLFDELIIYDRALSDFEINELYVRPDQLLNNPDTLIYLGGNVQAFTTQSCTNNVVWSPATGVSDVNSLNPILSPTTTTTYQVSYLHVGCTAKDTFQVIVIDPSTLSCEKAFLPNAFTPNGDGKNDVFLISNPFVIEELISFEVFDRLGNRMFYTNNINEGWDGTFGGTQVNSGVMLYKVLFKCNNEEKYTVGSVTLIR